MQRIAIIGPSGSGKTTLGRWLANARALPFTDLDDVHWRPGWQPAPEATFTSDVRALASAERWVLAGNYPAVRAIVWARMDTLIWLDLALGPVLLRSTRRALRQWWTREPICNGNRQTLWHLVNGPDSLIGHTLRTYRSRRRQWPQLIAQNAHAQCVRLQTQAAIDRWKAAIQAGNTPVDR